MTLGSQCRELQHLNIIGCVLPPDEQLLLSSFIHCKPQLEHHFEADRLFAQVHDAIAGIRAAIAFHASSARDTGIQPTELTLQLRSLARAFASILTFVKAKYERTRPALSRVQLRPLVEMMQSLVTQSRTLLSTSRGTASIIECLYELNHHLQHFYDEAVETMLQST
jgi:hypothetical protein